MVLCSSARCACRHYVHSFLAMPSEQVHGSIVHEINRTTQTGAHRNYVHTRSSCVHFSVMVSPRISVTSSDHSRSRYPKPRESLQQPADADNTSSNCQRTNVDTNTLYAFTNSNKEKKRALRPPLHAPSKFPWPVLWLPGTHWYLSKAKRSAPQKQATPHG